MARRHSGSSCMNTGNHTMKRRCYPTRRRRPPTPRRRETAVPRRQDQLGISQRQRRRQVNGIGTAEGVRSGESGGVISDGGGDLHDVEGTEVPLPPARCYPTRASRSACNSPTISATGPSALMRVPVRALGRGTGQHALALEPSRRLSSTAGPTRSSRLRARSHRPSAAAGTRGTLAPCTRTGPSALGTARRSRRGDRATR